MKYTDERGWTDVQSTIHKIDKAVEDFLTAPIAGPYDKRLVVDVCNPDYLRELEGVLLAHVSNVQAVLAKRGE